MFMPTRWTPINNGGLSLLGLVSHYLVGGAKPDSHGTPISAFVWL